MPLTRSNPLLGFVIAGLLGAVVVAPAFGQEEAIDPPAESTAAVETPDAEATVSPTGESSDEAAAPETPPLLETDEAPATDEPAPDEIAEAQPEAAVGVDWAGLLRRFPEFFAVTHHAAVHLPIALWLFGALFVVIGLVVPSLRNQVPVACLIGGAITSVAAAASGWWYADFNWGEPWAWGDGLGDFDEHLVKHRWMGVALAAVSLVLSVIAIVSQARRSRRLGFVWRLGLIGLALAVGWEGHLGGELIQGEGFLEEAFQEWVDPEAAE